MKEITITTQKMAGAHAQGWQIWGWEIPVYLFLGGLTAGIIVVASWMILKNRGKEYPVATNKIMVLAPVLISLGMGALFLDLSHKLYVWRFYTTFQVTSVMSWGSWILVLVYPVTILLVLATFREGFPAVYGWVEERIKQIRDGRFLPWFKAVVDFAETRKNIFAKAGIPIGIGLGIYTGILLSAFAARPIWNSAILGPLFLVSGMSTGVALIALLSRDDERHYFARMDMGLIVVELFILFLFFIGQLTSGKAQQEAISLLLGGSIMTPVFWIFVFTLGLFLPLVFEWLEMKGRDIPAVLPPVMVLFGGLMLRFVLVKVCCLWRDMSIDQLLR
ncbi:MAG: nitrite reductase [Spirochaetae bacterium HGW-Spirochaetae-1]|jgi:formate-dependent nitrite reductase membrane component NrfD|nr:MAG: nitrite reductase [Spirochaetae bacterium HGW-Spirochaetae-1]